MTENKKMVRVLVTPSDDGVCIALFEYERFKQGDADEPLIDLSVPQAAALMRAIEGAISANSYGADSVEIEIKNVMLRYI